jgi:hypothetical protein
MTADPRMAQVTLLTQPDCGLCEHAKKVIARVRADHPLAVTEVSLTSAEGQQAAAAAGVLFAPGILLDGAPFSYGRLSERRLRKALTARPRDTHSST